MVGNSHGTEGDDQSATILAENPCQATRLAGFTQILRRLAGSGKGPVNTETAMSRQEGRPIAVLIFTCDSTRLLIHSGGTAVRDESRGRVPHLNLLVAEQIQYLQHFWAEGSTLTCLTRMAVGSLLILQSALIEFFRDGLESGSRHPLSGSPSASSVALGIQFTLSPI